ncbi:hypothetical protein [Sediminibacillus halophilus]|uniref:Nucleoside-diphosphate-sugar epimerase n=1 Tax=Sediminibacillus halophilus TaxID=482461 RepID=A0A1G9NZJ2_9BACI|nr:hypothetical protein [Sediminibacillus halophilus]SDL92006.1 hypothetical protein SAMN05216244_1223 [Sediminibacillus halophilus]
MKNTKQWTVAVAGSSRIPVKKILSRLDNNYHLIRISGKQPPEKKWKNQDCHTCDLFNPTSVEKGLQHANLAIFLYPTEFTAARLSQATLPDMAVLAADSFARAIRKTGIKKIIFIKPEESNGMISNDSLVEVEKVLSSSGVPIRTISIPVRLFRYQSQWHGAADGVRSIQRVTLPHGKDAKWAAFHYPNWLNRAGWPLIKTEWRKNFCNVYFRSLTRPLLVLHYSEENSDTDRAVYHIAGGALAADLAGRLEFCQLPASNHCLIAIHEFQPSLPWLVYKYSQAIIHLLVMGLFKKHLERIA